VPAVDSLIMTCKLNDIDPQAWLADGLARIAGFSDCGQHSPQLEAGLRSWTLAHALASMPSML
jgi:IS66 C-terminal element